MVSSWSFLKGRHEVQLWNRRLPFHVVQRAITVVVLYLGTLLVGMGLLALIEPFPFRTLLFEAVSALGTVGLSLGVTPELTYAGKIVYPDDVLGQSRDSDVPLRLLKREIRERVPTRRKRFL